MCTAITAIPQPNVSRLLQALIHKEYVARRDSPRHYSHHLQPDAREPLRRLFAEAGHLLPDQALAVLTGPSGNGPQA